MNKRMREILSEIADRQKSAQEMLKSKDLDGAQKALDEIDALKREYELTERAFADAKDEAEPAVKAARLQEESDPGEAVKAFGRAAKAYFSVPRMKAANMSVSSDENGGYVVPQDVSTKIEQLRSAKASLLDLVGVESVSTMTGSRTYERRASQTGFSLVAEGAAIPKAETPTFSRYGYAIKKYGGYFALTNELLSDSDANVAGTLMQWIADESRATANRLIQDVLTSKAATAGGSFDDIRSAFTVTLGQAFADSACVVTNDDGLNWLDTLKDSTGAPLLKADPTDPLQQRLAIGFRSVPLKVFPNSVMASPSSKKLRFIVGDLAEGVRYFDRKMRSVLASNVATAGDLNAFDSDLTLYRAIEREDVVKRDPDAWVNLEITPSSGASSTGTGA